jgi:hypothetical protein
MRRFVLLALIIGLSSPLYAAAINQVSYASLTGAFIVTFDDLPPAGVPGTKYDTTTSSQGVVFGERFAGQTLSLNGNFDVLDENATGPLTVVAGAPNQNVSLLTENGTNVITGLGPLGFPTFDAIGEGSLAFSFSNDQSQFGFQLVGGNGGDAFLSFFRRDGSLIQTIDVPSLADDFYGFSRDGGLQDIAGVSIYNNDPAGIGLDNLKHDVVSTATPEPSTFVLTAGVLAGLALVIRRRLA